MLPDSIKDRWNGSAWRWWSLSVGMVLAIGTGGIASVVAALIDGDVRSLVMLGLTAELFVAGLIGSGMVEGLASRAIAGGMARQPLPERRTSSRSISEADRLRRDRVTVRSGLVALPLLALFLVLLLS